ncbi:G1/S-specific cyclin-E1 [Trebouxia sp. C0010 RCD-2024]
MKCHRAVSVQSVQCPCRVLSVRPRHLTPATRLSNTTQLHGRGHTAVDRLCPLRASRDGQHSRNKQKQAPQQPEVDIGPIPTDEATEAADTEPATAPAADASMPQQAGKSEQGPKAQKGSKPAQPKGKPDFEQAGALADWLRDAAAEMKKQGVSQKFTDSFLGELVNEISMQNAATEATHAQAQAAATDKLQLSKDQFIRLNADFDNYRRRTAGEKLALKDSTKGDVIMQLVPLIDNFEAAKNAIKVQSDAEQKIVDSYQGLYKQMVESFRSLGVEATPGVGHPFDPRFHDAIMQEPNDDVPDGTVLAEFRKGFKLGDKLLRAAMVKVSSSDVMPAQKPPASPSDDAPVEVEEPVDAGAKFD